jgi:hypothetical protein
MLFVDNSSDNQLTLFLEESRKMLRKLSLKLSVLTLIFLVGASDSLAQTRVQFARGRNSATLSGSLTRGGRRSYVLRAGRGQTLTATVSSTNGKVDFTDGSVHDTQYSRTLEQSGDVYVDIDNHGSTTRYTLTISIQ